MTSKNTKAVNSSADRNTPMVAPRVSIQKK